MEIIHPAVTVFVDVMDISRGSDPIQVPADNASDVLQNPKPSLSFHTLRCSTACLQNSGENFA